MPRYANFDRSAQREAGKPHCKECGRILRALEHVGNICKWCHIVSTYNVEQVG